MVSQQRRSKARTGIVPVFGSMLLSASLGFCSIWAGESQAGVSPQLQRPPDIPLERLDRLQRPRPRRNRLVNINTANRASSGLSLGSVNRKLNGSSRGTHTTKRKNCWTRRSSLRPHTMRSRPPSRWNKSDSPVTVLPGAPSGKRPSTSFLRSIDNCSSHGWNCAPVSADGL